MVSIAIICYYWLLWLVLLLFVIIGYYWLLLVIMVIIGYYWLLLVVMVIIGYS